MKKNIKTIVTDLDRTLLRTDKTISSYTADVLNRCRKRGIKVVFATARAVRLTKRFCETFEPDAIIADNGALIDSNGTLIHKIDIPRDIINSIISELVKCEKVSCITVETGASILSNYTGEPWDNDWNAWNMIYTDFLQDISLPVTKFSVECKDVEWLNKLIDGYPELHIYSNSGEDWSQIMHRALPNGTLSGILPNITVSQHN